jgi:hypothetical protein
MVLGVTLENDMRALCMREGVVYSGMGPDFRVLVKAAQKKAQKYFLTYRVSKPFPYMSMSLFHQSRHDAKGLYCRLPLLVATGKHPCLGDCSRDRNCHARVHSEWRRTALWSVIASCRVSLQLLESAIGNCFFIILPCVCDAHIITLACDASSQL